MFYDNDTYLEEAQKKNPLLNEVYANCMGQNQQETEFTCVAKRKRNVLVSIR